MRSKKQKFERCHFLRIILFAEHLEKCKPEDYPMEFYCDNECMPYILNDGIIYRELPIFAEWDWVPESGITIYKQDPHRFQNTEEAIMVFFGMSGQQFCRYLLPYAFKDSLLHKSSTPKDVAQGLYELVGVTKRFVLIEKFKS
jgi:hypothetical protein